MRQAAPRSATRRWKPSGTEFMDELGVVTMVARRELIRYFRAKTRLVLGALQPAIFLLVMGYGLGPLTGRSGGVDLKQFLLPGMIAMSIVSTAIGNGANVVWDREFGFMREMIVAPPSRLALVAGRTLGGGLVATVQGAVILPFAPVVGLRVTGVLVLEVLAISFLTAVALTSFGILLASRIKKMQTFQVVLQVTLLPMLFLSGAMFPTHGLPSWLGVITRLNPLAYAIDPLRRTVISAQHWPTQALAKFPPAIDVFGRELPVAVEIVVLLGFTVAFTALSTRSFGRPD